MKPLAILLVCIAVLVYRRPRPVRVLDRDDAAGFWEAGW